MNKEARDDYRDYIYKNKKNALTMRNFQLIELFDMADELEKVSHDKNINDVMYLELSQRHSRAENEIANLRMKLEVAVEFIRTTSKGNVPPYKVNADIILSKIGEISEKK